jgi:dTDP-4-amino-4,6-dideoxy-D-galactose acyltransferase
MSSGSLNEVCEFLEWDSAFFGVRIGRVEGDVLTQERVRQIDEWCNQNAIGCLYFLARSDHANTTRLAEEHGFRLVDIRVTLTGSPSISAGARDIPTSGNLVVRGARLVDVPTLQSIARESHHDTRFYHDPGFAPHLCDALYETWIKRSCEGYADVVLVAESNGLPAGYVSCHLADELCAGRIGLAGVSRQVQNKGVGQALVLHALDWFADQGAAEVSVVTQGRNVAAQRLYQRCGFLTREVQLWYHKWYTHPQQARD